MILERFGWRGGAGRGGAESVVVVVVVVVVVDEVANSSKCAKRARERALLEVFASSGHSSHGTHQAPSAFGDV